MTDLAIHTLETAPEDAKPLLKQGQGLFGFIPNVYGAMANAPATLGAYMTLTDFVSKTSFTADERNLLWLTISAFHDCTYCMAGHSQVAALQKTPADVVKAARSKQPQSDPKLEALRVATLALLEKRGRLSGQEREAFVSAGYRAEQLLEILVVIAHKTLSNYTNHIVDTPTDEAAKAFAWSPVE